MPTAQRSSVRLVEVAKRAGVSTATVSRVLNGQRYVSEAVRSTVLAAVAELNYHPSAAAQVLASGRTRTMGIAVFGLVPTFLTHEGF